MRDEVLTPSSGFDVLDGGHQYGGELIRLSMQRQEALGGNDSGVSE
jgi:hypothetical protein